MTEYGGQFAPPPSHPGAPRPTYGTPGYPTNVPGYPPAQGYAPAPGYPPPPGYPPAQGYPPAPPATGYPQAPGYPPPPAPGYPAMPPMQPGYGAPAGQVQSSYAPAYGGPACRLCGSVPAAEVTFRQHTGMLFAFRWDSVKGPFCRDCGTYVFRKMTAHTLLAGWWSYSSVLLAPITLLINVARRGKVANLAPPIPQLADRRPADPGKPLYQRPAILGLLVPVLLVIVIIVAATSSSS